MADEENMPMTTPKRYRRHLDIYDVSRIIRMAIVASVGGTIIWGAVLGDIWLWRLLYG